MFAYGVLQPQIPGKGVTGAEPVQIGPLLDWGIVADGTTPHIVVFTDTATYRLGAPLEAYGDLFAAPLLFARAAAQLRAAAAAAGAAAQPPAAAEGLLAICKELMVAHGYREHLARHFLVRPSSHPRCFAEPVSLAALASTARPPAHRPRLAHCATLPADGLSCEHVNSISAAPSFARTCEVVATHCRCGGTASTGRESNVRACSRFCAHNLSSL